LIAVYWLSIILSFAWLYEKSGLNHIKICNTDCTIKRRYRRSVINLTVLENPIFSTLIGTQTIPHTFRAFTDVTLLRQKHNLTVLENPIFSTLTGTQTIPHTFRAFTDVTLLRQKHNLTVLENPIFSTLTGTQTIPHTFRAFTDVTLPRKNHNPTKSSVNSRL
jgi:hypothetical protein